MNAIFDPYAALAKMRKARGDPSGIHYTDVGPPKHRISSVVAATPAAFATLHPVEGEKVAKVAVPKPRNQNNGEGDMQQGFTSDGTPNAWAGKIVWLDERRTCKREFPK